MEQLSDSETIPIGSEAMEHDRVAGFLRKIGADDRVIDAACGCVDDIEVQNTVRRFRAFAQENPAVILAAVSALVVGGTVATRQALKRKASTRKRTRKTSSKGRAAKKTSRRTLIEPHAGDKRYIRRDARGRIKESVDVGKSLSADRRRRSKRRAKSGEGDRGDR